MGEARRKRMLPVPPSLLSPMLTITPVLEIEVDSEVLYPSDSEIQEHVRSTSQRLMEETLNDLRMEGVTEEQIANVMGATSLDMLVRLLDLNVDEIAYQHMKTRGASPSVSQAIATMLLPEVGDLL